MRDVTTEAAAPSFRSCSHETLGGHIHKPVVWGTPATGPAGTLPPAKAGGRGGGSYRHLHLTPTIFIVVALFLTIDRETELPEPI